MHNLPIQELRNIDGIDPKYWGWCCYFNIKDHKFVVWSVVNSFLDSFWTLHEVRVLFRPRSSEILSINLDNLCFRICLPHLLKYVLKLIVNLFNSISSIVEGFSEIVSWILAGHWDLFWQKISSSAIPDNFLFAVVMNRKIGAMNFLRGNPEDFGVIVALLLNFLNELVPRWELNWGIFLELKLDLDWLFLHVEKCLILL